MARRPFVLSLHKHLHTHTAFAQFYDHFHFINDLCLAPFTSLTETYKRHTLLAQEVATCISSRDAEVSNQHMLPPSHRLGSELDGYPRFSDPIATGSARGIKIKHHRDFYLRLHKYETTTQTNKGFLKSFKAFYRTTRPRLQEQLASLHLSYLIK